MGFLSSLTELKLGEKIMGFVTACATWRLTLTSTLKHKNWVTYNTKQVAISAERSFMCKLNMLQKFTLWSKLTLIVSSRISLPPPLNLNQSFAPPLLLPPAKIAKFGFPLFVDPPLIYNIQVPPTQNFQLSITGLHKLTINTLSIIS